MGLPLFYVEPELIDLDRGVAHLRGADARHLVKSLRARVGDTVLICDAMGTVYTTSLTWSLQDRVTVSLHSNAYHAPERPQVVLFQAMGKNAAMDELVSYAAEVGISRIVPYAGRRSPLEALTRGKNRIGRWSAIARESSRLSRRPYPLEMRSPVEELDESVLGKTACRLVLWEEEKEVPLSEALPAAATPISVALIAGPEGGLDPAEISVLRSLGARTVSLGLLNLRARSAGPVAAAITRNHYGLLAPGAGGNDG